MMQECKKYENKMQAAVNCGESKLHFGFGVRLAKQVKVCAQCGTICLAAQSYCTDCGNLLPQKNLYQQSVQGKPFCNNCGAIIGKTTKFCPKCGKSINNPNYNF